MLANFQKAPNFAKYGVHGSDFKTSHWDNTMYGGPITDSVYSCANKNETCKKDNTMQKDMGAISSAKGRNGHFIFTNLPVEYEGRFMDIEFFSSNSTKEVWDLMKAHNASESFSKEAITWTSIATGVTGYCRMIIFDNSAKDPKTGNYDIT